MSKRKVLQHKPTGRIFAWNEELAKRNDMVAYEPEPKKAKDDIKDMARAVLTKKPGRKPNAEAGVGETEPEAQEQAADA